MKTLTVEEAVAGLGGWLERALAGEQIQIRKGDAVVELRPTHPLNLPERNSCRRVRRCGECRRKPV